MKRIKEYLIHLLGGVTQEESVRSDCNSYNIGIYLAYIRTRMFADRMNGVSADEWCKRMYAHLCECIEQIEKKKEGGQR